MSSESSALVEYKELLEKCYREKLTDEIYDRMDILWFQLSAEDVQIVRDFQRDICIKIANEMSKDE